MYNVRQLLLLFDFNGVSRDSYRKNHISSYKKIHMNNIQIYDHEDDD